VGKSAASVRTVLQAQAAVELAKGRAPQAARLQRASAAVIRQQRLPGRIIPYVVKLATTTAERTRVVLRASAYASGSAVGERMRLGQASRQSAVVRPAGVRCVRGAKYQENCPLCRA